MKKNKLWIFLILIIPVLLIIGNTQRVKADSGFDTSYDSGGSSWSSSSSDWSSSDYSSSTSSSGGGGIIIAIIFFIPFIVITIVILSKAKSLNGIPGITPQSLPEDYIKKFIPDFDYNKFVSDRFNDYVEIQNAWMNFDYDTLRNKLTDELYNQYAMQLDTMKIKNEQNIMRDFSHRMTYITDIKEENGNIEVTINSVISFYDYIVQNARIVRGNKNKRINSLYEMKFICNKSNVISKCPNCHAPLNNNASQVCEYCGSVITKTGENWVMTKKQTKRQW